MSIEATTVVIEKCPPTHVIACLCTQSTQIVNIICFGCTKVSRNMHSSLLENILTKIQHISDLQLDLNKDSDEDEKKKIYK